MLSDLVGVIPMLKSIFVEEGNAIKEFIKEKCSARMMHTS